MKAFCELIFKAIELGEKLLGGDKSEGWKNGLENLQHGSSMEHIGSVYCNSR